jgi:hypothetical protein
LIDDNPEYELELLNWMHWQMALADPPTVKDDFTRDWSQQSGE